MKTKFAAPYFIYTKYCTFENMNIPEVIKFRIALIGHLANFEVYPVVSNDRTDNFDSIVCGIIAIEGIKTAVIFSNTEVKAGSLNTYSVNKINILLDKAEEERLPILAHFESTGARIQDGIFIMKNVSALFYRLSKLSGLVPTICIQSGINSGATAYCAALMDIVIMIGKQSQSFITGPKVIKRMLGREDALHELGNADTHTAQTGFCTYLAFDETEAYHTIKKMLCLLYKKENTKSSQHTIEKKFDFDVMLQKMQNKQAYDILPFIEYLCDESSLINLYQEYAKNCITAFASIQNHTIGIIANQSCHLSGALDVSACKKIARFIQLCNAYRLPMIFIADCPGFMPGKDAEEQGILLAGAKILDSISNSTVPKINLVINKLIGGAYAAMCPKDMGANYAFAWTNAQIAVMGLDAAFEIIYKKQFEAATDKSVVKQNCIQEFHDQYANLHHCLKEKMIDKIITPESTKATLIACLNSFEYTDIASKSKKNHLSQL